jgi:hypothetical protein
MKTYLFCFFSAFILSVNCIAAPIDSLKIKHWGLGIEIPYSSISEKNLKAITNGTACSKTLFYTGVSVLCNYYFNNQLSILAGLSIDFGQYSRYVIYQGTYLAFDSHHFNELKFPLKLMYVFNKRNKRFNFFAATGYSLSFINNNNRNETQQFSPRLPNECLLSDKYYQSSALAQIGCCYRIKKTSPFVCLNANYSSYFKDYYGLSIGINF